MVGDERALLLNKLKTLKTASCSGVHCDDLSKLGPFDVDTLEFRTDCADRKHCVECTDVMCFFFLCVCVW